MLKTTQAASGMLFFVFLIAHLINTWLAIGGELLYNDVQSSLRQVYQFPAVEIVILGALLVHISAGILRYFREPRRDLSVRAKWHRVTGVFLLLVIFGHIAALRAPSFFAGVYPEFAGVAFAIEYLPYVFIPYYIVLPLAGLYHGINGLGIASRRLGIPAIPGWRWPVGWFMGGAAILSVAVVAQLAGVVAPISDPGDSEFARFALDFLGELP